MGASKHWILVETQATKYRKGKERTAKQQHGHKYKKSKHKYIAVLVCRCSSNSSTNAAVAVVLLETVKSQLNKRQKD